MMLYLARDICFMVVVHVHVLASLSAHDEQLSQFLSCMPIYDNSDGFSLSQCILIDQGRQIYFMAYAAHFRLQLLGTDKGQ